MRAWTASLVDLLEECSREAANNPGETIIAMCDLLDEGGSLLSHAIGERMPSVEVRRLVADNAPDSAALGLLGANCGLLLSKAPSGQAGALVTIDNYSDETSFFASATSVAIIGALGTAILQGSSLHH